ncbi:MAG TPA: HAMP domain-containing sensor histidine kinase [Micropepsaceae bacterium]|nr:HAMP domain-containing sensor histidine kinase [Micropepsaceae bacterium]
MLKELDGSKRHGWRLAAYSLSGRLLLLTILFVMLSVALIYFPSVARYHHQLLQDRINSAQLAILPFTEAPGEQLSERLRTQLLARAGVEAVILRGGGQHELFLSGAEPPAVETVYDAGETDLIEQIRDVIRTLFAPPGRTIRIDADLTGGRSIVVVANEEPIRAALFVFSTRALLLSIFVSVFTSLLVFVSLYMIFVRPMQRITGAMVAFRNNPEDPAQILQPSARKDEIGTAERELSTLQRELYSFLQQKTRLAALGLAVAKIQHDLRNILSSAQIASDRLADSEDPVVKRVTPRLVDALDRAIALATNTLRYGRAEERTPQRAKFPLAQLVEEAAASALPEGGGIEFVNRVPGKLQIEADSEQLFRVILNLLRNAREALEQAPDNNNGRKKRISVEASRRDGNIVIEVADNGPGIPSAVRARLFQPFAGSARSGGSGLGLAISRELVQAHGGDIVLASTGEYGTTFCITMPERVAVSERR